MINDKIGKGYTVTIEGGPRPLTVEFDKMAGRMFYLIELIEKTTDFLNNPYGGVQMEEHDLKEIFGKTPPQPTTIGDLKKGLVELYDEVDEFMLVLYDKEDWIDALAQEDQFKAKTLQRLTLEELREIGLNRGA